MKKSRYLLAILFGTTVGLFLAYFVAYSRLDLGLPEIEHFDAMFLNFDGHSEWPEPPAEQFQLEQKAVWLRYLMLLVNDGVFYLVIPVWLAILTVRFEQNWIVNAFQKSCIATGIFMVSLWIPVFILFGGLVFFALGFSNPTALFEAIIVVMVYSTCFGVPLIVWMLSFIFNIVRDFLRIRGRKAMKIAHG